MRKSRRKSPKKSPRKSARKSTKKVPRRKSRVFLRGGAGQCVNAKTPQGLIIDPISMGTIPLNKNIQLPTKFQEFPYDNFPDENTDYYCFNQDTLMEWLKNHSTNPFTGKELRTIEASILVDQMKGPKYVLGNGYRSVFSHAGDRAAVPGDASPWPEGLRRAYLGGMFFEDEEDDE
jgi:hypothetical protein